MQNVYIENYNISLKEIKEDLCKWKIIRINGWEHLILR